MRRDDLPHGYVEFFDELETWGRTYESVSRGERSRIDTIAELLPHDAATVLDVGCGDGVVTNRLADMGVDVTGADLSAGALRHVRAKRVQAPADALPFTDRSFDCVLAADLLEHLPAGVFERTLAELDRVASRFLIVNCPHREDLALAQTRCGRCETAFHASRHVRTVDERSIAAWFPSFEPQASRLAGEPWPRRSRRLQRAAQLTGNVWYRVDAVCPTCGYRVEVPSPHPLVRAANGAAQRLVGRLLGSRPSELVVLLRRR